MASKNTNSTSSWQWLRELVAIDSPTGYTEAAGAYVYNKLKMMGWSPSYNRKGGVHCTLGDRPKLLIAAHFDTLGAMVKNINEDGSLSITKLGGPVLASYEGSYLRIITHSGKVYTGTLLLNNPSSHVNKSADGQKRTVENMHIRLDEEVKTKADTLLLGINTGDIIAFDPSYQELDNGFIKSKFMDNKAGCMVLLLLAERIKKELKNVPVELYFSNYEEVGHGSAIQFDKYIEEMIVIDMGVVGNGCAGEEIACSICAKDSSGPYDYGMRKHLIDLADIHHIPYRIDIYPYYGSDGSAALIAGNDMRVALIGPGVAASHGIERTHKKGIVATLDLCMAYINDLIKNK